jgi:hypothetical protein
MTVPKIVCWIRTMAPLPPRIGPTITTGAVMAATWRQTRCSLLTQQSRSRRVPCGRWTITRFMATTLDVWNLIFDSTVFLTTEVSP